MSLNKPILKLRNWIDINKIKWVCFSSNPRAIEILSKNKKLIGVIYLQIQFKYSWFIKNEK